MTPAWAILSAFAGALLVLLLPAGMARVTALAASLVGVMAAAISCLSRLGNPANPVWSFDRPWIPSLGVRLHLAADGLALTLLLLTGIVAVAGVLFSWNVERRPRAFFAFFLTIIGGVYGVFLSRDAFLLFVCYEIVILPKYMLIAIWGSTNKEYGAMKLTMYSIGASALILIGLVIAYAAAGGTSFDLAHLAGAHYSRALQAWAFPVLFLGFSMLQMISHGIIAGLLFGIAGRVVYERTHTRDLSELGKFDLWRSLPGAALGFTLATAASMGLPGFSGFVAEISVTIGLWQTYPWLVPVIAVGIIVTGAFSLRALHKAFFPVRKESELAPPALPPLTWPEISAIGITSLGVVLAALSLFFMPPPVESVTSLIVMDPLARIFKAVVLGLGLLAVLLPPARREIAQPGEFYALILFALTGLLLTTGTNHLLFLFVALELTSLSLYLLAGFSRSARAAEASLKYFLFGGVSAAFLLFGLSLIYGFSHSATLHGVAVALAAGPPSALAIAGLVMVVVGLGFKLAAAPFHYWAPDVYQGAPATSVALISAASKAVGLVVLVRFLRIGFHSASGSADWGGMLAGWSPWLAVLAAVSMVFGNVLALAQTSVRRLLAYSAVANTGYLLVALSANGISAAGAALFYVVVYGLATLGALAVTAAVERDRGNDSPAAFAGLIHRSPWQAVALLVFLLSLAGIPPLAGFVGKFAMFSAAMAESTTRGTPGLTWLVGLAAVMSAISLYYYLSVLKQASVREAPDDEAAGNSTVSLSHRLAIALPAVALVVLGLFPALLLDPIIRALAFSLVL